MSTHPLVRENQNGSRSPVASPRLRTVSGLEKSRAREREEDEGLEAPSKVPAWRISLIKNSRKIDLEPPRSRSRFFFR